MCIESVLPIASASVHPGSGYNGEKYHPKQDEPATFTLPTGETMPVSCFHNTIDPLEIEIGESECSLDKEFFNSIDGKCVFKCPFPVHSTSSLRVMWFAYILPPLCSLPLNLSIVVGRLAGTKFTKGKIRLPIFLAAIISVIFCLIDVFPSTILFTDVACGGRNGQKDGQLDEIENGTNFSFLCILSRQAVYLLQMVMNLSATLSLDLYLAVVKSKQLENRFRMNVHKCALIASIFIPSMAAILAEFVGEEGNLDHFSVSIAKQNFTCVPYIESLVCEWLFVHAPFIVGAAFCAFFCGSTLTKLFNLSKKVHVSPAPNREKAPQLNFSTCIPGLMWHLKKPRTLATDKLMALKKGRALKLLLMTILTTLLLTLHVATTIVASVQIEDFTRGLEKWLSDIVRPESCGDDCLDEPADRPNRILNTASYLSMSAVPMVTGFVFGQTRFYFEAFGVMLPDRMICFQLSWKKSRTKKVAGKAETLESCQDYFNSSHSREIQDTV